MALRNLDTRRRPLSREGRLSRQMIAIALILPPDLYTYLVFGEKQSDTGPNVAVALKDTDPPKSPP